MPRSGGLKSPAKMLSRSAPTSPKNLKDLTKSSTLPPPRSNIVIDVNNGEGDGTTSSVVTTNTTTTTTNDGSCSSPSVVSASPRKSRNATFSNFFKKLSPKLRQSGSSSSKNRDKTWYVVEIAQKDVDGQPPQNVHETPPDLREPGSSSSCPVPLESCTSSKKVSSVAPKSSIEDTSSKLTLLSEDSEVSLKRQIESTTVASSSYEAKVQQVNASFGGGVGTQPVIRINSTGSAATQANSNSSSGSSIGGGGGVSTSLPPSGPPRVRRTHQPPRTLNILNKIVVQHPYEVDKVKGKMTSVESIGSCSLDVDATASESSATADGRASSVSQRTLHSASVDLGSGVSNILGGIQTESVRSPRSPTRISVKKSGSVGGGGNGGDVRYISELYIPNGRVRHVDEEEYVDGDQNDQRKPSYISISCSVSGYTSYSCYNSKVREGLRSRDNSPARLAFTTVANGDSNPQLLGLGGAEEQELNEVATSKMLSNSVKLNVNGGGVDVVDRSSRRSMYEETTTRKTSPLPSTIWRAASDDAILSCHSKESEVRIYRETGSETRVEEKEIATTTTASERISESEAFNNNNDGDVERKSLIQQRIERLYGPSALAQGFRLHRERRYKSETSTVTKSSSSSESNTYPPVFKHLCPTFYDQLVSSHSSTSPVVSPLKSADHLHSPKTLIGTNLKSNETSANEIRTNGDITKHNGFHVETREMLKGPSEEELLIVADDGKRSNDRNFTVKDGKWFIEIMNEEQRKIKALISRAEEYLNCDSPPEEACGRLRAAIGKANLLLSQKFQQFRGLCEKNVTQSSDEPFPTTASDLAGFWDMVLIQVQEIHKMFDDIEKMREKSWIVDEKDEVTTKSKYGGDGLVQTSSSRTKRTAVKKPVNAVGVAVPPSRSIKADEAARTREEARKRLLEAKRKGRQQSSAKENSVIEIFVPENKD